MKTLKILLAIQLILTFGTSPVFGQNPEPPVPVEIMIGHKEVYSQFIIKKFFNPTSKFDFFGLATYSANYENNTAENSAVIISQVGYNFSNGFGVMTGIDFNSFSGFSPILGPKHSFANKKFLAVTNLSFFVNESLDAKLFGLYEYHPGISEKWKFYSRLQFIHNISLNDNEHNISNAYLRVGLQKKDFIFGLGGNFEWSGPNKVFSNNFGPFIRWEFE
ncbi:hypothetical protein KO566_13690 [Flavobacteriaceae bacterium XHP0103]|uniref:hypothetical protein n=1 Tax=Marixanthotalea marina TaxID=2844359 RepID=UPI002989D9EC|nr:hypothetical protein [Marixanthotalea marina]MBU3823110.1 hypothetical protein [Marixanthotalea marina]